MILDSSKPEEHKQILLWFAIGIPMWWRIKNMPRFQHMKPIDYQTVSEGVTVPTDIYVTNDPNDLGL